MMITTFKPTDHKIRALIYGPAGCGKTVFAGTAPKAIYASAEGGLLSIADKAPEYVDIKTLKDLRDLLSFLKTQKHSYETVVIDSITEINEIIKSKLEDKREGGQLQLQDWGVLAREITDILRSFRDLPMNVVFIAQEAYITDEDKIKKVVPSLNGKAATGIAYYMDIVGYVNIENDGTRWIQTSSDKKLLTKDRSKMIGDDCPMDFAEWLKRVTKIKVGTQDILTTYEAPTASTATKKATVDKTTTPHLDSLKAELKSRGHSKLKDAVLALNEATKLDYKDLKLSEEEASKALVALLQQTSITTTK